MKKKLVLFLLQFVTLSLVITAQNNLQTFTTSAGQKLVSVSVYNLGYIYSSSLGAWENKIQSVGGGFRKVENGGISYSIGSTSSGGIQYISKYPDGASIMWLHAGNRTTIMDNITDELQRYYVQKENGYAIYLFKVGDDLFKVSVKRDEYGEFVIFEKQEK